MGSRTPRRRTGVSALDVEFVMVHLLERVGRADLPLVCRVLCRVCFRSRARAQIRNVKTKQVQITHYLAP